MLATGCFSKEAMSRSDLRGEGGFCSVCVCVCVWKQKMFPACITECGRVLFRVAIRFAFFFFVFCTAGWAARADTPVSVFRFLRAYWDSRRARILPSTELASYIHHEYVYCIIVYNTQSTHTCVQNTCMSGHTRTHSHSHTHTHTQTHTQTHTNSNLRATDMHPLRDY